MVEVRILMYRILVLFSFQPLFPPAKKAPLKKPAVIPRVKINSAPTIGSDSIYQVSVYMQHKHM